MKVLVPIKRVIDANVRVRVLRDQSGVDLDNVKMAINPFCEVAVEEAVRMKDAGAAAEVIAVSAGSDQAQEILRSALAMGADRAILIDSDEALQPLTVARLLKAVVDKEGPELVILGKQAIDGDNNQTGQMLAALLGWSQGTFVSKIEPADGCLRVTREVDGGLERLELTLPSVVTVDLRLNEPRHPSLPSIMRARKKPYDIISPTELGVDVTPRVTTLKVVEPPPRAKGKRVADVAELVDRLKNEAKVDPSRKSGGALHRLHCFCLEFDGACEVQRRVPTDWIIEPIDVPGYGSFSLAS